MANTQYITTENDRWDLIAVAAYGDCTKTQIRILQNANPNIPIIGVFKAGVKIVVPIIEVEETDIAASLPPWKRIKPIINAAQVVDSISNTSAGSFDSSFG